MPFGVEEMARHFLDAEENGEVTGSSSGEADADASPGPEATGEAGDEVSAIAV